MPLTLLSALRTLASTVAPSEDVKDEEVLRDGDVATATSCLITDEGMERTAFVMSSSHLPGG